MDFTTEIQMLEDLESEEEQIIRKGSIPILFSAPHTMEMKRDDGTLKLREPYTKAIALYLNKHCNVSCIVKNKNTKIDSNRDSNDDYNLFLREFVKENQITLVIDLHGASNTRPFDVEFGTLNHLTADYSTIKELEEAFTENNIFNVSMNTPFKGGAITKGIYGNMDVEVIQLEINRKFRDLENPEYLLQLLISLRNFIEFFEKKKEL